MEGDVNALFLVLGGVSLLVGATGIADVTLVSVLERVGEVGRRRALGAATGLAAGLYPALRADQIGAGGSPCGRCDALRSRSVVF